MSTAKKFTSKINNQALYHISFLDRPFFGDPQAEKRSQKRENLYYSFDLPTKSYNDVVTRHLKRIDLPSTAIYSRVHMDRRLFSKATSQGYHPSKNTVIALALAFKLTYDETQEMLMAAGYYLSSTHKPDMIVIYFINKGEYDLVTINSALRDEKCPLIIMNEKKLDDHLRRRR